MPTPSIEEFVEFFVVTRDALDLIFKQTFTKVGPVGTHSIIAEPHSSVLLGQFADKHGMTVSQAVAIVHYLEAMDGDKMDRIAGTIDVLEQGATKNDMDFRSYALSYFEGMNLSAPPNLTKN